jgi:hypothetical protein
LCGLALSTPLAGIVASVLVDPERSYMTFADTGDGDQPTTLFDGYEEAVRVIDAGTDAGVELRLFGGLAFYGQMPTWTRRAERPRRDLDFVVPAKHVRAMQPLMTELGYAPEQQQNAIYGHKQMYFVDEARQRPVDVIVDRLEMCHILPLAGRLGIEPYTLPRADLLLSKLQIVKINEKDVLDCLALLSRYPMSADEAGINVTTITALTSTDWGWWRTVTGNLDLIERYVGESLNVEDLQFSDGSSRPPLEGVRELRAQIDASPKSLKWKMRAKIGERAVWYDEPEEFEH